MLQRNVYMISARPQMGKEKSDKDAELIMGDLGVVYQEIRH